MGSLCACEKPIEVTIGVCVKNSEVSIEQAIKSILYQDYPAGKMELIIVDGESKDGTLEIIKENLKNNPFKTILLSENKGLGLARQLVVEKAAGKYIAWVDGDMILSREFIRKQVEFMNAHPNAGIAKGQYELGTYYGVKQVVAFLEDIEFLLGTLTYGRTAKNFGTSGCFYRVSAIRQIGGFDLDIVGAIEDFDAEIRLRAAGWALYVSQAKFREMRRSSWKSLWSEYFWFGQGSHQVIEKNKQAIGLYKIFPPIVIIDRLLFVQKAYLVTRRKIVLISPLHYFFKRVAWVFGFILHN